jgi:hypothetical protein
MIFTMLAPEFILGKSVGDLAAAWQCRNRMKDFAEEDKVEWSLSHGFYANMGGFVCVPEDELENKEDRVDEVIAEPIPLSAQAIYFLRTLEHSTSEPTSDKEPIESQNKKKTAIKRLPDITTTELHDKSKGDVFIKVIAVVQVFWVVLQIIVRARKGLTVSQLELAVAAFSTCAIITYLLLIPKPQDVRVPSRLIGYKPRSVANAKANEGNTLLRVFFYSRHGTT